MKRNKIAMLLAMALTVTQSVAVPVAAEELTADAGQEVEMSQDDADAEAAVESEGAASEDAEVNIQEDEFSVGDGEDAEIQEEAQNVDFTAGDESTEAVGEEESKYSLMYDFMDGHTGNGTMLPNSQMTISTSVYHSDEDGDETISEAYKLELKPMEDDWDYTGKVDVSVDDNNIVINSHGVTGAFGIYVTVSSDAFKTFTSKVYFEISEYEDIYELNQAVAQLKQLPEQDYEKVMDYCDARDITSPLEISNVCLQADEVPYERFPDWIDENVKDPEEKLGYALFENNSLAPEIKAAGMEGYFDYKAYGRDEAINSYDIGDHGFVNKIISIDVEKYSYEEIQNQLKENGLDESTEYKEENTWESEENFWSDEATYEQETYMASDNEIMVEEDIEITMDN